MTCIVGLVDADGAVWLGADSVGANDRELTVRADRKLVRCGEALMGFTTSFRMGQLLAHKLELPALPADRDPFDWMVREFVDATRQCLKDGGYASKTNETESGGVFLVAIAGRLFRVDSDYQVAENEAGFDAVGGGGLVALGSLAATRGKPAFDRVVTALAAAEEFNPFVRRPFFVARRAPMTMRQRQTLRLVA